MLNLESNTFLIISLIISALVVTLVVLLIFKLKRNWFKSFDFQLLLIKLPKQQERSEGEKRDLLTDINLSEQLFSSLSSIKEPFVFEMANPNLGEEIFFYLAVPKKYADFAAREIHGLFPESSVTEVADYNIFSPQSFSVGAYLKLNDNPILPIRSYRESEVDTFAPIVSTFSKMREAHEGAALQIVMRPSSESFKKRVLSAIDKMKKGESFKDVKNQGLFSAKEFNSFFFPTKKSDRPEEKTVDEESIKALQAKVSKPLFKANIRILASAPSREEAEGILLSMASSFSQFSAPLRNRFREIRPRNLKKLIFQYVFREYADDQAMVLNSEELASLFHLPTKTTEVPRIVWLNAEQAPPPANLPTEGVVIGESVFRGENKLVRMTDDDRRRHLYIIGQTGTGKSYLMVNMAVQDMQNGHGLCMIDPHGASIEALLEYVPPERLEDIIYFDPSNLAQPIGLNMLEYDLIKPEQKTFIVNELLSIFSQLYDLKTTGGPMFEYYLRKALLLLMGDAQHEPATLMEVPRIFTDSEYRNAKLARCTDPLVVDFWTKEATKTSGESGLANMAVYINSKFASFISNDYMKPVIGQVKSAFNFRQIMDSRKILLVNLAKGKIGDLNSALLGMIFTGRLLMAALSREDQSENERRDFYLYIDEFQNYTTDSVATILSEARKYKLDLILAHQYVAQLKDNIREAVFGNVGSLASFRVGAKDAEALIKQFSPEFTEKDLISIENRQAYLKLLINGEPARPFSFRTLPGAPGAPELKQKLKELSALTYGRPAAEVEAEILSRLRSV